VSFLACVHVCVCVCVCVCVRVCVLQPYDGWSGVGPDPVRIIVRRRCAGLI